MVEAPLEVRNRQQLLEFMNGRSETEIVEVVQDAGVERVLQAVFDAMAVGYVASAGPAQTVTAQWDIQAPDGTVHIWQNRISRAGFESSPTFRRPPDVSLQMDLVAFLRLMAGTTRGVDAVSLGTLKLEGDVNLAIAMEAWFGRATPS